MIITRPLLVVVFLLMVAGIRSAHANANTFEVGTGTIASTLGGAPDTFTTFTFSTEFQEVPLVFVLPSTQGGDECDVRIQSVTLTTFDAFCTEAPPRDGQHAAMTIQYLAVTAGTHAIPTSGGGTVTFEAGFIDTQTVQHNCASGCGTEGWDVVTPGGVNAANASILTQIQTMANESNTPPSTSSTPFLTTAMDLNQGLSTQFGLALERNEVNNGSITTDERIAWLAVEDSNGCVTLDFSTLGGPASVPFQSITTDDLDDNQGGDIHDAVDGWTNGGGGGCQSDEGATFAVGCFTTTPVVLANKRTRNELDGGWLRQCFIGSNEIRLTIQEDRDRDNERSHANEGVSVLAFGQAFTTPVTLSQVGISQHNREVTFNWQTATETFNIGFNLWGKVGQDWEQLNPRLVPSHRRDKLKPKSYQHKIRLSRHQRNQVTEYGISSVDSSGKDEFFGPFEAGESYGEQAIPEPIDWRAIKAEFELRMHGKGYRLVNGRWKKPGSTPDPIVQTRIDIGIEQAGIYKITHQSMLAMGVDWTGVALKDIAVTLKGKPVARHIVGGSDAFGSDSHIEFYAVPAAGEDALYTARSVYQLELNRALALDMIKVNHRPDSAAEIRHHGLEAVGAGNNRFYSSVSTGDPWMDHELFSYGAPAQKTYTLGVPEYFQPELGGRLWARLSGGINISGDAPDHHLRVFVNDELVVDQQKDGFDTWEIDVSLPPGTLRDGANEVRFELPGDTGFEADIVNIDRLELHGLKTLNWSASGSEALVFIAEQDAPAYQVQLTTGDATPRVYITQPNGNVALLKRFGRNQQQVDGQTRYSINLPVTAMHGELDSVSYWIGNPAQMPIPRLELVETVDLLQEPADYLIIAHPGFIGPTLQEFAELKRNQGLATRIINWFDIVNSYGYGNPVPQALQRFLQAADKEQKFRYVLIVGGHSYDYRDYLGLGTLSFIPTWYRPHTIFQLAPTDTPFVDLDGDGRPDKAIGRWPVRTQQDLAAIVRKTTEWHQRSTGASQSALFIASKTTGKLAFDQQLEDSMGEVSSRWNDIERVYLDDFLEANPDSGVADARQRIVDRINQGNGLTVFNGHGSPSAWSFQNLWNWQNIQQLENTGKPTIVLPLACYTTYYEAPGVNTLAHQWLFSANSSGETVGAAAIHGAMVLGDNRENTLFADRVLKRQLKQGLSIGEAILKTKRDQAPWNEMINNWALLGDPSLQLTP